MLRRCGYDLHRLPLSFLTLRDLEFDLPVLVESTDPVVIDVGANVGQTIDLMRRTFSKPIIYSFEPNPDLVQALRNRYEIGGVVVESVALGNSEGTATFYQSENSELSSLLEPDRHKENPFAATKLRTQLSVAVTRLDSWLKKRPLKKIDILKIDTQGFDLEVLRGASAAFDARIVEMVLIEVNFLNFYKGQSAFGDIVQFMKDKGYGLLALYEIARVHACVGWATACFRKLPPQ
jgi:FkbM family methyltransferase